MRQICQALQAIHQEKEEGIVPQKVAKNNSPFFYIILQKNKGELMERINLFDLYHQLVSLNLDPFFQDEIKKISYKLINIISNSKIPYFKYKYSVYGEPIEDFLNSINKIITILEMNKNFINQEEYKTLIKQYKEITEKVSYEESLKSIEFNP